MKRSLDEIARALRPLDAPPLGCGWNHDTVSELIGDRPRRDAAVLVAIRDAPKPSVVFTLRRADLAHHAGQVSFPGGAAEPRDAGPVATALRESHEEVALHPADVAPLGFLDRIETISGFCVTPVVARMQARAALVSQPGEVARVFEAPLDYLLDPANLRERFVFMRGPRRAVYEYQGSEPCIWGATAAMLVNLMRRMGIET